LASGFNLFLGGDSTLGILESIRDRCYDFEKKIAEKFGEKNGVFDSNLP
jgi:hypothetical protein